MSDITQFVLGFRKAMELPPDLLARNMDAHGTIEGYSAYHLGKAFYKLARESIMNHHHELDIHAFTANTKADDTRDDLDNGLFCAVSLGGCGSTMAGGPLAVGLCNDCAPKGDS